MQQAPSTPRRRAPRAAPPSSARVLKRQKMVSSGAGLVSFCGFARHLLAGFLSPTELARTARVCVALRGSLAPCVVTKLVPPLRRARLDPGWCYSIRIREELPYCVWGDFFERTHDRTFHNLRQCLLCLHAMRISPARSHQSLVYILRPPPSPASPRSPSTSPD